MNIALVGYGKMGKAIEKIAVERGHYITLKIATGNKEDMTETQLKMADVVIEFTGPESARDNVAKCLRAGVPVVSGSTGWNEHLSEAKNNALENKTAFLHSSNFSVGVNIFFEVNTLLARLMNQQQDYNVSIAETHHTEKKDAPSGTAITLAEQILDRVDRLKHWTIDPDKKDEQDLLPIKAYREEQVPGTHHVRYTSPIDEIEIIHTAHSREGFAKGAVLAAEFLAGKRGIYTMKDVLGIRP
ncbi:MAG TPA: 4-hydroxy-tetrahydrodipicolinate reductase [Flavipsychrobacter sp.]|nr:4-hydroxy-tetrahydrodipicolinate reductase [Flavipsychrobacter sp.]